MSHTKGPWKVVPRRGMSDNSHGVDIVTPDAGIAWVFPIDPGGVEGVENANLMAAAPELAEALATALGTAHVLCALLESNGHPTGEARDRIEACHEPLAKARGRQS